MGIAISQANFNQAMQSSGAKKGLVAFEGLRNELGEPPLPDVTADNGNANTLETDFLDLLRDDNCPHILLENNIKLQSNDQDKTRSLEYDIPGKWQDGATLSKDLDEASEEIAKRIADLEASHKKQPMDETAYKTRMNGLVGAQNKLKKLKANVKSSKNTNQFKTALGNVKRNVNKALSKVSQDQTDVWVNKLKYAATLSMINGTSCKLSAGIAILIRKVANSKNKVVSNPRSESASKVNLGTEKGNTSQPFSQTQVTLKRKRDAENKNKSPKTKRLRSS